jgi:glycosyltransferase involved in cell wall biosynthesis
LVFGQEQEIMVVDASSPSASSKIKIAIVGDALRLLGGSEKVTLFLNNIFPDAPIYTSVYIPEDTFPEFKNKKIITLPLASRIKNEYQFKRLFPWWYLAFSLLDLRGFDIIISSSSYLAKYINPPKGTVHICYLQNPFRLLWKPTDYSAISSTFGSLAMMAIKSLLPFLRKIDVAKTRRIHRVIANSQNMARQIQRIYEIEPDVIYPPIDTSQFFITDTAKEYYLYAGRLISHKRADLAVKACNQLGRKLIVAGDGLERPALEKLGAKTVKFVGRVSDEHLKQLYSNCIALLFPSDEDFGIIPVEVQASGRPIIAYRSGGALETVLENKTGIFFNEQTVESLCSAILAFEKLKFDSGLIRENAQRFDQSIFKSQIISCVDQYR